MIKIMGVYIFITDLGSECIVYISAVYISTHTSKMSTPPMARAPAVLHFYTNSQIVFSQSSVSPRYPNGK